MTIQNYCAYQLIISMMIPHIGNKQHSKVNFGVYVKICLFKNMFQKIDNHLYDE